MCVYHIWKGLQVVAIGPRFVRCTELVRLPSGAWGVVPHILQPRHRHRQLLEIGNCYEVGGRYRTHSIAGGQKGIDYIRVWHMEIEPSRVPHQYPQDLGDSIAPQRLPKVALVAL